MTSDDSRAYGIHSARHWHSQTNLLNWSDGGEVMRYAFLHLPEFFPHAIVHRSGPISDLPVCLRDDVRDFPVETRLGAMSLDAYVHHPDSTVDGVVIAHAGTIVYEAYPRMRPFDKHLHMSVAKVFASAAVAILRDRGLVDDDAPVERYVPDLAGTGWEGVRLIDVLDMASGIACLELTDGAYSDPEHLYYQYEAAFGFVPATDPTHATVRQQVASLRRLRRPGTLFEYTSPNTFVLSWIVEEVSGLPYAEFLSQEIWSKIGAESDALIAVSRSLEPAAHNGLSTTLRDLLRFGLLYTPSWRAVASEPLVSPAHLDAICSGGRPDIYEDSESALLTRPFGRPDPPRHSTHQWDFVMPDGDHYKGGYGGQGLYVSPSRDLVVAFFGASGQDKQPHELKPIARRLALTLFGAPPLPSSNP